VPERSGEHSAAGTLYVVGSPLGNLEDITLRALRVLREVDLVAAEDTRRTRKLLDHFGIAVRLTRYDEWVEREKAPRLIRFLCRGGSVALLCDAGTPGIRDPGFHLVDAAVKAKLRVVPVPGPSAVTAALSVSAFNANRFAFEGFVPEKPKARHAWLVALAEEERTWVCFEAARRLETTLTEMHEVLGDRRIVVARELTKLHEEFLRGSAQEVLETLRARGEPVRGEVTIVVEGSSRSRQMRPAAEWQTLLEEALARGRSLKEAAREVAAQCGVSRRTVYTYGLQSRAAKSEEPE